MSAAKDYWESLRGTRPVYPTIDTRGVKPIEAPPDSTVDKVLDALAAGVGVGEEHFGELTGWKNFTEEGRAIKERNLHQYEDNSFDYHLQNILMSAPESAAIMAASMGAGWMLGGPVGALGGAARGILSQSPRMASLMWNLAKAYQGGSTAAKVARTVIPSTPQTAIAVETGALMEAQVEGLEAEKRYIENAKANGTYVEGQTEAEAAEVRSNVVRDNVGIVSMFNAPQYQAIMGRPVRSLLGKLGRFGAAAGSEGAEEVAQELASAYELGESPQWRNLRDAAIAGTAMGGAFHGIGRGVPYALDRIAGRPTYEELEDQRKANAKEFSERIGKVNVGEDKKATYDDALYGAFRSAFENFANRQERGARQSYREAAAEQETNLRNWANKNTGGQMSDEVFNSIVRNAQAQGVPVDVALAVATAESNGNQDVVSPVGAIGVMQLMPSTAESLGVNPNDTEQNIRGGMKYLKQQYDKFGDWNLAFAAYNAGAGAVEKYNGIPPYAETQKYVAEINKLLGNSPGYQGNETRGGNVFGVENYDMPTQGDNITAQVSQLKPGWSSVIPQIGGVLKDKFGINATISSAARSAEHNAEVGGAENSYHIIRDEGGDALDIVFDRETSQEEQDAIADYFKSTGLFSEVLYHDVGSGAHLHLGGLNTAALNQSVQSRANEIFTERTRNDEAPQWQDYKQNEKPLFDINAEDETTRKLFEQYAEERLVNSTDRDTVNFFDGMFTADGNFQNTPENRDAIRERYGDDFIKWVTNQQNQQNQQTTQEEKSAQSNSPKTQPPKQTNSPLRNAPVIETANKFLEQLRAKGDPKNLKTALNLQTAISNGDIATVENILKQNNVTIPTPQTQTENIVKENTTPENVTKQKTSPLERQIKTARAPVPTGSENQKKRIKQGNAIIALANENKIDIPDGEVVALQKGSTKAVQKWRDTLLESGILKLPKTQEQPSQPQAQPQQQTAPNQKGNESQPLETSQQTAQNQENNQSSPSENQQEIQAARENWENTKRGYQERGEQIQQQIENIKIAAGLPLDSAEATAQVKLAMSKPLDTVEKRTEQGKALTDILSRPQIKEFTNDAIERVFGLKHALEHGSINAILTAQKALNKIEAPEQTQIQEPTPPQQSQETPQTQEIPEQPQTRQESQTQIKSSAQENQQIQNQSEAKPKQSNRAAKLHAKLKTDKHPLIGAFLDRLLKTATSTEKSPARTEALSILEALEGQEFSDETLDNAEAKFGEAQENQNKRQENQNKRTSPKTQLQRQALIQEQSQTQVEDERKAFDLIPSVEELNEVEDEIPQNQSQSQIKEETPQPQTQSPQENQPQAQEQSQPQERPSPQYKSRMRTSERVTERAKQNKSRPKQAKPETEGVYGDEAEAETLTDAEHQVRYKVVEASDLTISHRREGLGVVKNVEFPDELQPRDRERTDMQQRIIEMISKLVPKKLLDLARSVNLGMPVVRKDGVVLNGNGRALAVLEAYKEGKAEHYKDALIDNAHKFGLNASKIARMKQPILIRELVRDDLSLAEQKDIAATTSGGAGMSASEQARADAKKINPQTIASFPQGEVISLKLAKLTAAAKDFLRAVLQDIVTRDEVSAYTDNHGRIAQNGIDRAVQALVAYAYENDAITARVTDKKADDDIKNITDAIIEAVPEIARIRAEIDNGTLHSYNLDAIAEAAEKLSSLKDEGMSVTDYLNEGTLGDMGLSAEAREILQFLDRNKRSSKKIAEFLKNLAQGIREQGNPNQGSLFGEVEAAPLMNLIKSARQKVEGKGEQDFFAQQEEKSNGTTSEETATEESSRTEENSDKDTVSRQTQTQEITESQSEPQAQEESKPAPAEKSKAKAQTRQTLFKGEKEIKEARQKIEKEVPAGTKVRVKAIPRTGSKEPIETHYIIGEGYIQRVDEDGNPIGKEYVRDRNNTTKFFVRDTKGNGYSVAELEIEYPNSQAKSENESENESETESETKPETKAESKPAEKTPYDAHHEKLKTDKHPHLKAWLDAKIKAAESGKQAARVSLKNLLDKTLTNEQLNFAEEYVAAYEKEKGKLPSILAFEGTPKTQSTSQQEKPTERLIEGMPESEFFRLSPDEFVERFKGKLSAKTVFEWYQKAKNDVDGYASAIRDLQKQLNTVFEDRELADTLAEVNDLLETIDGTLDAKYKKLNAKWESLLTNTILNEAAKDPDTANALKQLGAKIESGKVTFPDKASRQAAIAHINNMQADDWQAAGEDVVDTKPSNFVAVEKLSSILRAFADFAKEMGVSILFFKGDKSLYGTHRRGVSYYNVDAKFSHEFVYWHEFGHWLKNNQPKLFQQLLDAAEITDEQIAEKRKSRKDLTTDEEIKEEIICDAMSDMARRTGLLKQIGKKNPSLIERLASWAQSMLRRFTDWFHMKGRGLNTEQRNRMFDAFGQVFRQIEDGNGNKLFRYNRRTHELEHIDGRKLETVDTSGKTKASMVTPETNTAKFSMDTSDNSNESFLRRVKNFISGQPRNERMRKHMKRLLSDLSRMKITAGNLPEGIHSLIDYTSKVIRTSKEYDWVHILPTVGEQISKQLKITPTADMSRYIAKWIMDGAPNDTSAEATEFAKAMRKADPEYRDKLLEVQSLFADWNNMSGEERAQQTIQFEAEKRPLKESIKKFFQSGYDQFIEQLEPINRHVQAFEKATGMKLDDVINPMSAFRNLRGMAGRAERLIKGSEISIEELQTALPNINFSKFKTLRMILESIDALENKQTRRNFSTYITCKHVKDIHTHNKNIRAQQAKVRQDLEKLKRDLELTSTKKERKAVENSIEKKEESLKALENKIFDTAISEADCDTTIAKYEDQFGAAQKDMVEYSRTILAFLIDSGLMSQQRFHEIINSFPNYVPLHRAFDENADLRSADSLKHMMGSSKDIIDPLKPIMSNTFDFVKRAEKNKAKLLLANLSRFDGVGGIFEEVEKGTNNGNIITFYENGKRKYLECSDESIAKAVNHMTVPSMNWYMRILRIPAKILTFTTTAGNINFGLRNLFRDAQDAFIYSSKHGGNIFQNFANALVPIQSVLAVGHALKADKIFERFMIHGGAQASFFSFDRNYEQDVYEEFTKGKFKRFASPMGIIKFLELFGEYTELGTRLKRFEDVSNSLAQAHGGKNIYGDFVTAALESRDLMDFARSGEAGRTWNTGVAFANVALQGWDKFYRTFNPNNKLKAFGGTEETQREWLGSIVRLALTGIALPLVLWLFHRDKDWYKEDVQDWQKETHWIIGKDFHIPKGADVGIRFFSNFTERALNYVYNKEPQTFKAIMRPLWEALPDFIPTIFQPALEIATNHDLFRRRSIVPMREQKLPAEMQYDSQTSNFAKFLGDMFGIAPRHVDHLIYGHTGNMGKGIMRFVDAGANAVGLSDRPVNMTRDWIPFVGGFLRVPYRNPKIVTDYYEALDKQASLELKYKATKEKPDGYDPALYGRLKAAKTAMQKLAAQERAILENTKLTREEADERQRKIQEKRVALCEKVFKRAR